VAKPWYFAFETAWRWGSFVAAHIIVACILIGGIKLVQYLLLELGDTKLFDIIPLRYIFDGMELGVLVAFVVLGTLEAISVFRERH
jgi:hypothetical protein